MVSPDPELIARMELLRQMLGRTREGYRLSLFEEGVRQIASADGCPEIRFPVDFSGWWVGPMEVLAPKDQARRAYAVHHHDREDGPREFGDVPAELLRNAFALGLCLKGAGKPVDLARTIPARPPVRTHCDVSEGLRREEPAADGLSRSRPPCLKK
jgi:hypothetical protein